MSNRPLAIVTGASRGLGLALVQQLLDSGHDVLAIARRPTEARVPAGARLDVWCADLAEPAPVAERLAAYLDTPTARAANGLVVIHNAALLADPAALSNSDLGQLAASLRVGLEAPLLLSAALLKATADWAVPRRLLMISSGLGRYAMAGSAAYCATKAGLDNLARAIALEEALKPNGAKVVSLAPGVIDTDMQVQLRGAPAERFSERQRFQALHDQGALLSPAAAAEKVLAILAEPGFGDEVLRDVRR